jgi:hypothetical protein
MRGGVRRIVTGIACHSANSTQLGRVVVSPQVLCFQRLDAVEFALCHFATVSYTPTATRLATSWECQSDMCVSQRTKRESHCPASGSRRRRRWWGITPEGGGAGGIVQAVGIESPSGMAGGCPFG